jgi:hypothetical protein
MNSFWIRAGAVALLCASAHAEGDGLFTPWRVDSSVPDTLQSIRLELAPEQRLPTSATVRYEIGFSTFETAGIGFLFDSLTLSLARLDGSAGSILVTADVFGLTVAPLAPGGFLSGGGIRVEEIAPLPGSLAAPAISYAYRVEVTLPPSLRDQPLRTTFDFFGNGDAVLSRGQARVVAVPEPSLIPLAAAGAAVLGLGLRGRRFLN